MRNLCRFMLLCLVVMAALHDTSEGRRGKSSSSRKGSSSSSSKGSSSSSKPSKTSSSKGTTTKGDYPRQATRNVPAVSNLARGYPHSGGSRYPSQYPAGGGNPSGGQHPGRGESSPGGYPNQYPARGGDPSVGGAYPNWNPNNKIPNPRYGGGEFGGTGHGVGSSKGTSKGFGEKAVVAAGVGAVAGMAVGYGLGHFPRPHLRFGSPQEEQYYNHYLYRRYGNESTDGKDYGHFFVSKPLVEPQNYETHMDHCMNRSDLLQDHDTKIINVERQTLRAPQDPEEPGSADSNIQGDTPISRTSADGSEEDGTKEEVLVPAGLQDHDGYTVSIVEVRYPALLQQMKARKCVQLYISSEGFLQKTDPNGSPSSEPHPLLSTVALALSSALLLQ